MLVYGECECFDMQLLYVCILSTSCGSSQCCVLHDLQFVNAGRGCNRRPYRRGILSLLFTELFAHGIVHCCNTPHQPADNPLKMSHNIKQTIQLGLS